MKYTFHYFQSLSTICCKLTIPLFNFSFADIRHTVSFTSEVFFEKTLMVRLLSLVCAFFVPNSKIVRSTVYCAEMLTCECYSKTRFMMLSDLIIFQILRHLCSLYNIEKPKRPVTTTQYFIFKINNLKTSRGTCN